MGHRRFLPDNHSWRIRYNQYFDDKSDRRRPPKELNGEKKENNLKSLKMSNLKKY